MDTLLEPEDYEMVSQLDPKKLMGHWGHPVVITSYGETEDDTNAVNYSLECELCNEVLADANIKEDHHNMTA